MASSRSGHGSPRHHSVAEGHVGETQEIAHAYVYCMTQPFATGSVLTVDGGTVLV